MSVLPMQDYPACHSAFRWEVPQRFNFGRDVVDAHAARQDRLALVCTSDSQATQRFLFSDIARLSAQYAHVLRRAGLRAGDRVLVQLPRIAAWHIAMTACTKLGLVPVPCIGMLTAKDVLYRIAHCDAQGVITLPEHTVKYQDAPGLRVRACIGVADGWLDLPQEAARENHDFQCEDTAAETPAILFYTSGSSGLPKGVCHASRALWAWRYSSDYWQAIGAGDLIWCTADTGWSKCGTGSLFGPWGAGSAVMVHDGVFDPARRMALLDQEKPTVFCAAATEFRQFIAMDLRPYDLSRLRLSVSAGESVNPEVVLRWRELTGVDLLDGYGQTETLMTILNYPGMPVKPGSMGRPLPGSSFEVVNDEGEALADDEVGQIALVLPNPQWMLGYWNDPEKTRASTLATARGLRWLTGDMGYRDRDGYFFYTGRADDIISSAGYRIGPMEVENAIMEHPCVLEVAVVGKKDAERGEIVKAFVVLKPGYVAGDALVQAIQQHVKTATAPYKYPREISFLPALPKNPAGKLLRRELRDRAA